jgi:hypothetical protein
MKTNATTKKSSLALSGRLLVLLLVFGISVRAQDSTAAAEPPRKPKPVKNTFGSQWLIEDQTVMVPVKGTFELDFQHRFGTLGKGYQDFYGVFSPNFNIRFGFSYTVRKNLSLGFGFAKSGLLWDGSAKYAIIEQTPGVYPVSVTYFGDAAVNTQKNPVLYDGSEILHASDRWSFYNSILVARKINDKLSVQVGLSYSWQNAVGGYYTKNDSSGSEIYQSMYHYSFTFSLSAKYKISESSNIIFNYDQPLTNQPNYNPYPNLGLGFETNTSGHTFQIFVSNYSLLNPQENSLHNGNAPFKYTDNAAGTVNPGGQWLIGFNMTKLWIF